MVTEHEILVILRLYWVYFHYEYFDYTYIYHLILLFLQETCSYTL